MEKVEDKNSCLICRQNLINLSSGVDGNDQCNEHVYKLWEEDCAAILCELLLGLSSHPFKVYFQEAGYCSRCRQTIRDISFSWKQMMISLGKIRLTLEHVKGLLRDNYNSISNKTEVKMPEMDIAEIFGYYSYDEVLKMIITITEGVESQSESTSLNSLFQKSEEWRNQWLIEQVKASLKIENDETSMDAVDTVSNTGDEYFENVVLGDDGLDETALHSFSLERDSDGQEKDRVHNPRKRKVRRISSSSESESFYSNCHDGESNSLNKTQAEDVLTKQIKSVSTSSSSSSCSSCSTCSRKSTKSRSRNKKRTYNRGKRSKSSSSSSRSSRSSSRSSRSSSRSSRSSSSKNTDSSGAKSDDGEDVCFKCNSEDCGKIFKTQHLLNTHVRKDHEGDPTPYHCKIPGCDAKYDNYDAMWGHHKKHSSRLSHIPKNYSFHCPLCGLGFDTEELLQNHSQLHESGNPFICELCQKEFTNSVTLKYHVQKLHLESNVQCSICERFYRSAKSLEQHMEVHSVNHVTKKCQICSAEFVTTRSLKTHLRNHAAVLSDGKLIDGCYSHQCETCGGIYKNRLTLNNHIKSKHAVERPVFKCSVCDKQSFSKTTLTRHEALHSGFKTNVICELCGVSCTNKYILARHFSRFHIDDNDQNKRKRKQPKNEKKSVPEPSFVP